MYYLNRFKMVFGVLSIFFVWGVKFTTPSQRATPPKIRRGNFFWILHFVQNDEVELHLHKFMNMTTYTHKIYSGSEMRNINSYIPLCRNKGVIPAQAGIHAF